MDLMALLDKHGFSVLWALGMAWAGVKIASWIATRIDQSARWGAERLENAAKWFAPLGVRLVEATEANARNSEATLSMLQTLDGTIRWNHEHMVDLSRTLTLQVDGAHERLEQIERVVDTAGKGTAL